MTWERRREKQAIQIDSFKQHSFGLITEISNSIQALLVTAKLIPLSNKQEHNPVFCWGFFPIFHLLYACVCVCCVFVMHVSTQITFFCTCISAHVWHACGDTRLISRIIFHRLYHTHSSRLTSELPDMACLQAGSTGRLTRPLAFAWVSEFHSSQLHGQHFNQNHLPRCSATWKQTVF